MSSEAQLRDIVKQIEEEHGARADDEIMMRPWPLEVREQALGMIRKTAITSALVEEGEVNPEELKG